jgi:hypothetical protein
MVQKSSWFCPSEPSDGYIYFELFWTIRQNHHVIHMTGVRRGISRECVISEPHPSERGDVITINSDYPGTIHFDYSGMDKTTVLVHTRV